MTDRPRTDQADQLTAVEFASLRTEIVKHYEIQFQLVAVAVVALGTMLSVGYQTKNAAIMSLYPLLSLMLGAYWLNMAEAILRCADYIRSTIEPLMRASHVGWESHLSSMPIRRLSFGYWGVRGIFLGGPVVALLSAATTSQWSPIDIVTFTIGALATGLTFAVFISWRERSPAGLSRGSFPPRA
ncbi:hypothetical protein [Amycolatopsis sp. NPDC051102]|uniref:hypothetical protein n=1 Tax=Amycolatopsis sp. NPDC051102 TaxID=3155163 RepID=UPI00342D828B